MTVWLRSHYIQVLAGIVLAILPLIYFQFTGVSWYPLQPHDHLVQNALAYCLLVLFTYLNHTVFVPRWFLNKHYRRYVLIAVVCIMAVTWLPYRIEQWVFFRPPAEHTPVAWLRQIFVEEVMLTGPANDHDENSGRHHRREPEPHRHHGESHHHPGPPPFTLLLPVKLAIFFLIGLVSTLISISVQTASRLHKVETDQLQAELRQLKAQIQPHFLFNTLNSIYALAIRQDDRTADTIVKLSEFMRYIIRDAHYDRVALEKEINYITNYIDLQKARLRDAVEVVYTYEGDDRSQQIAPLILFSFIENAFKYGVSPEEESRIDIRIQVTDNRLTMEVVNKKVRLSQVEPSTGIGLQNTRERLRLLYPDAHKLTIEEIADQYYVHLNLTLS